jgi:allantoinase
MPEEHYDLVIRGRRILTGTGIAPHEVGVRDGKIAAIEALGAGLTGADAVELAGDEILIPGLVDTHVHVNEPGRTEWEGFASATRAAAAGGVTTIIDMPLNSIPPTTTVANLKLKREVAEDQAFVDVGFWGGAIPGNTKDQRPLHDEGVFGFKCFLLHSGVDEFPDLGADEMEQDMAELRSFDSLMLVHAEDPHAIDRAPHPGGDHYETFLASRPRAAENTAIAEVIDRARRTGARAHIVHLSSSDALPMIASAKRDGVKLTVETCPHYLTLMAEEIPDGATAYKCCPPIREAANRELLWQGLQDGTIDCIVSDHSPSTLDLKDLENGDFAVAWGGVSSLQLGLSLIWTEARRRGIPLEQVVAWMAEKPAVLARVPNKGRIAPGYDADFAVFAPDEGFVVDVSTLKHRNPITPYDGKALTGQVRKTYLRGIAVDGRTPTGKLIRRNLKLALFNTASRAEAEGLLRPCIDIQRWVDEIASARPFASEQDVLDCARQAADPFTPEEIHAALAHHPRIGERPTARTTEAALSRSEQAGLGAADAAVAAALAEGNRAYEDKFGRVFLIRAAGRTSAEILTALRERLAHTPEQEEPIVAQQLREIALLRLQGVISP